MACVNPDGTLSSVAMSVLRAIADGADLPGIAGQVGVPLFRVRASLRELVDAGMVDNTDGLSLTDVGRLTLD